MQQLEELLGIKVPATEFYTLAGLALNQLQQVPRPGESFVLGDYRFTINILEGRRIQQIEARVIDRQPEATESEVGAMDRT